MYHPSQQVHVMAVRYARRAGVAMDNAILLELPYDKMVPPTMQDAVCARRDSSPAYLGGKVVMSYKVDASGVLA